MNLKKDLKIFKEIFLWFYHKLFTDDFKLSHKYAVYSHGIYIQIKILVDILIARKKSIPSILKYVELNVEVMNCSQKMHFMCSRLLKIHLKFVIRYRGYLFNGFSHSYLIFFFKIKFYVEMVKV